MHNCKATREMINELLLAEENDFQGNTLSHELENCDECREEFSSVRKTLRITASLVEKVTPPDNYWSAYHATLKQKLINSQAQLLEANQPVARTSWLAGFFKSSVRVPVPVGIGLMLAFALSLLLVARSSRTVEIAPPSLSVVQVPVEVPVIRERPVIRVVYRERDQRTISNKSNRPMDRSDLDPALAKSESPKGLSGDARPVTLTGFKPLDEIKLTVMRGGSPDEK
ncbi:MAG TPA: hypothetical protein VJ372_19695 [Pyrinomonadaceae bacterium]|jgi:hypothetical protein|nr:hypothetical protein [Pyrinomonadaceae bacterium]